MFVYVRVREYLHMCVYMTCNRLSRGISACGEGYFRLIALQGLPEVGTVRAQDMMDDGSPICLAVTIDSRDGSAVFDFEGTGPEVYGNCNAPPAVAYSAIIYSLRCMVRARQACLPAWRSCCGEPVMAVPTFSIE